VQKRVRIGSIIIALFAAAVLYSFLSREHEPVYQRKPLRVWLREARPYGRSWEASDSAKAVRKIGTNALPHLVAMVGKRDSFMVSTLVGFWSRNLLTIPIWARNPGWYRNRAVVLNEDGELGFEILGSNAEQTIPALMKLYEQSGFTSLTGGHWPRLKRHWASGTEASTSVVFAVCGKFQCCSSTDWGHNDLRNEREPITGSASPRRRLDRYGFLYPNGCS